MASDTLLGLSPQPTPSIARFPAQCKCLRQLAAGNTRSRIMHKVTGFRRLRSAYDLACAKHLKLFPFPKRNESNAVALPKAKKNSRRSLAVGPSTRSASSSGGHSLRKTLRMSKRAEESWYRFRQTAIIR